MKINVNTGKRTLKMRILSAFMAFLIFSLTFCEIIGSFGLIANAITEGQAISSTTITSTIEGITGLTDDTGRTDDTYTYRYNGKMVTSTVKLFDYLSDSEIPTGSPSQTWDGGYSNPYDRFNMAVSDTILQPTATEVDSNPNDNFTITFTPSGNIVDNVYVYMWGVNGSEINVPWPGQKMYFDEVNRVYKYTYNTTNLSSPYYIGFVPQHLIFSKKGFHQTEDIDIKLTPGQTYAFDNNGCTNFSGIKFIYSASEDKGDVNIYLWNDNGNFGAGYPGKKMRKYQSGNRYYYELLFNENSIPKYCILNKGEGEDNKLSVDISFNPSPQNGDVYIFYSDGLLPEGSPSRMTHVDSEKTYQYADKYYAPLYFGAFWMSNNENEYTSTNKPGLAGGKSGGPYQNFFWKPNISLKDDTGNYSAKMGKVVVQGLVDNNLSGAVSTGELLQNGKVLPYFSESWAEDNSNVMKYYNKDDTNGKGISFPFYEVTIPAEKGTGYTAGDNSSNGDIAKYYQFNSAKNNLYFKKGSTDHTGHFLETALDDYINGDDAGGSGNKGRGFFPFNTSSTDPKNYGFGARFDMPFHLTADGKVSALDSNGKEKSSLGRVNTRFEFTGDDDMWIFIDGHLVLDLGGVHDATSGYIDFTERKAVAKDAVKLDDGGSKDELYDGLTVSERGPKDTFTYNSEGKINGWVADGNEFTSLLNGNNTATTYDTNEPHTMTIFYMERGMFDSNLMIRFNFPVEPNFNKFKIREETNFSSINPGLVDLTKQAAKDDVFMYTIQNKGTDKEHVIDGTALYPSQVNNIRDDYYLTSANTPFPAGSTESKSYNFQPDNKDNYFNVGEVSYNWVDEFADNDGMKSINHVAGRTNTSGQLFLMYGTSDKKSSAEFEGQFDRYSKMKVAQIAGNDMLYKPVVDPSNPTNAVTFSPSTRKISDYYSSDSPYIFTKYSRKNGYTGTGVVNGNLTVANGAEFDFRSDIGSSALYDADGVAEVQMVPNKGGITIKKLLPSGETVVPSDKTTFTIKVRFEDVFGVSGVNANNASEYEAITYSVYDSNGAVAGKTNIPMGSGTMKVGGQTKVCGTVTIGVNQWAVIDEIPYNTKYIIDEDEPYYAKPTVTNNNRTVITGTINNSSHLANQSNNNAEVTNFSHTLTIKEVTDFSGVNAGLISYTKTAAEKDVFKYTVSNSGTSDGDVVDSGVKTPTYDEYKRGNVTLTKQQPIQYDYVYDYDSIFLDVKIDDSNYWDKSGSVIAATFQKTVGGEKTDFIIGQKIEGTNIYQFTGYSDTAHAVSFFRLNPDNAPYGINLDPENTQLYPQSGIKNRSTQTPTFQGGELFKITGWGSDGKSPCQEDGENSTYVVSKSVHYNDPHNYTPSVSNTTVSNTDYEWKDEFAGLVGSNADGINGMTGTTGNNGEFYLMHGTEVYTKNSVTYTQDKESSAKFYNQFARGSTMTVEQDGTLTSPNGGTPDTLKANNQRGAGTSLATYYTTTKTLEGSTTSSPLAENNNSFAFDNNDTAHSIHITETFTNSINTGTLKISKEIDPPETTNTTQTNTEFTFKITLTNVLGVTDNNVGRTDYANIEVTKTGTGAPASYSMLPSSTNTENSGIFTLKVGQTLTIPDIPVGTHYVIEELSNDDSTKTEYNYELNKIYKKVDTSSTTGTYTEQTGAATITGDIVSGETHDFKVDNKRKVGPLVLSKTVNGGTNANSGNQTNGSFTFKVELTEPTGVTFSGNYMTEAANLLRIKNDNYDSANHKYTFYETVTGGGTVTIPSVPYGTAYNVTEVYYDTATSTWKTVGSPDYPDPDHPDVSGNHVTGTIGQSLTVANTNAAEITNTYRKVTLTKLDSKDNDTSTGFKVDSAKYILLKLKDDLVITDAVKNIFASAESITDLHPEGEPSNLFYQDFSTEFTTGDTTKEFGRGQIVVRDSDITHGLTAGKYFFFETAAAGDNYDVDNTLTDAKIIEINATNDTTNDPNYTYTVDHTDPRKTGSLKLQKRLDDGTSDSTTEFTYHVELTNESTDVNLTKYMTQTPTAGIDANISGAAQAVSIANADYNAHKIAFDVKVIAGTDVTISGLPYDTTYDVLENLSSDQSALGWKKVIAEEFSDFTKTIDSTATDTVKVTNALIGDLKLKKVLGSNAATNEIQSTTTFYFEVILTPPSTPTAMSLNDFITNYIGSENVGGTDATSKFIKIDSDTKLKRIFTIAGDNAEHTEIIGLPYGTTYSVVEADESQNKTASIVYALNGTIGAITDKVIGANNVVTTTNNYPQLGSLNIAKTITGDNAPDDQQFTFTVTLTPQKETLIDLKDFTFTNTGGIDFTVSSDHKTITVKLTGGNNVIISGIPVGTGYQISESSVDDWTQTDSSNTSGTISADGIHASFTNNYGVPITVTGSLTVTKTDTNGQAITSSPATYYLLKLNSDFNTAYENDLVALSNIFKTAASVSGLSQYYSGYYGPKQTDSNGQVVFDSNDSGLDNISAGDKFFFYEVQAPYGYAIDNSLTYVDRSGNTHSKILTVTDSDKHPTAVYPNTNTTGVSVYKTNEYGEGLENGEFDLYYKQENKTTPPPTYSYNKPETPPVPEATTKINRNGLTVPDDAAGTSKVTTYTYAYDYPSEPSMPSSTEEDWILPRSDNDYIYFRDYNTGTINNKDTDAFYYQDHNNDQKRYWINTWLDNNEFGQNEEIGYDHRYKIKAQFKKSDGSGFKEYEAWERFVDEYIDTANNSSNSTRKTVVWKIQPPDGYNKVRFCLYDGGQCIRTTQEFSFVLGNIYTKTGQGTGTDNKWDYPVKGEHWSTNWNDTGAGQSDKRMSYSTFYGTDGTATESAGVNTNKYVYNDTQNANSNQQAPQQTQRYTATEQKIVFQCNSKQVWHNIHIEFFSSDDESNRIGQGFPGYMMEPYAFAGNDYRMKGYLTYELTIPKGATHFRINNGVPSGNFAYKTPITPLNTNTTLNNYGNFFKFPHTPQNGSYNTVDLSQWTKQEIQNAGDKYYATYNTADVESDYDYTYFRLPSSSGWSKHVYAYFYGGGDLRAHNWQRGVYSIWPGVAPVATEYRVSGGTDTTQHSDHYTYEYTGTLFAENPSSTGNLTGINPESTFTYNGDTVYKFKIPKSERVTYENNGKRVYDKVIFNDGFKKYSANTSTSSNNETGMIGFKAGYIYSPDDTTGKKYYGDATSNYTGRGDYLYINNAANWDNLHVTFYNANGTAIWQGGTGYIMQYEGTKDSKKYYRIPIPSSAAKFKLNNGKSSGQTSAMGVIYPKQNSVDTSHHRRHDLHP